MEICFSIKQAHQDDKSNRVPLAAKPSSPYGYSANACQSEPGRCQAPESELTLNEKTIIQNTRKENPPATCVEQVFLRLLSGVSL